VTKIAIQFEEEGFYVPLRQCKHVNVVLDKSSTAEAHVWKCADCGYVYGDTRRVVPSVVSPGDLFETVNQFGELRTREDWAVMIGAGLLAVALIAFDITYAISHWGRL